MMEPLVSHRFPYLPVEVELRSANHALEAPLDSGFDGDAVLPPSYLADGEAPDWYVTCKLGDGSQVESPGYVGYVHVGGRELGPMTILVVGDEPIVGLGVIAPSPWTTGSE